MAKRIQRKRTKGWKAPEGAVYVGRGTKWGNPFRVGGWFAIGKMGMSYCECLMPENPSYRQGFTKIQSRDGAVDWFREYIRLHPLSGIEELRGKDLMCFCPLDHPCHADVLLELANSIDAALKEGE